jgi:DNA repair photolyase
VTDPYQPVERRLELTRRCLEVLAEFRNPVGVITKSRLVVRDTDLFGELARHDAVSVTLSVTTLDSALARRLEPRAAQPRARLAAIEALARAGVPVGVNAAPVIPGLTDHELPAILQAAADHGAQWAGYVMLRLPHGVRELFSGWLETHHPDRKKRVLNRVREVRDGRLNDPRFGSRMRGHGPYADQVDQLFRMAQSRAGLDGKRRPLSTAQFRRPRGRQRELFAR